MGNAVPIVVMAAVAAYGVLGALAIRNPLLGRVAVREALRRPVQSALVIAGLTVGTGAILGPQIWVDSVTDSLIAASHREWARVDITVSAGGAPFTTDVARRVTAGLAGESAVGGVQAGLELTGSVANPDQQLGEPAVGLVGFDPAAQEAFGVFVLEDGTLATGQELEPGEVILSRSLAESIQAKRGDRVVVAVNGRSTEVTVAGVARPEGPGAYGLRPSVFAPLATAMEAAGSDLINVVRITAKGDGEAEANATRAAAPVVRTLLADASPGPALEVREVKAQDVEAYRAYQDVSRWVIFPGSFPALVIGGALVVNLILSIADERRPRLAILRALGLSRSGLVTVSLLEGGLYGLVAALASVVTAALIVWLMFAYAATAQVGDVNGRDVVFQPSVRIETVASAVAFGGLITFVAVFLAALRTSRMTITSAIRNEPEPESVPRRSWFRVAWLTALSAAGVLGLSAGDPRYHLLGGWALILVAAAVTRGRLADRTRATLAGALVTIWGIAVLATYGHAPDDITIALQLYLWGMLTAVFGLALMLAANLRVLEGLAGLLGTASASLRATLRPPLAYMTRRPMRAGLTVGVLGVVIAFLTVWTLAEVGAPDYERDTAGFDVVVASAGAPLMTLPADVAREAGRTLALPTRRYLGEERVSWGAERGDGASDWHQQLVPLYELSASAAHKPLPRLSQRDASFATDGDAYRAVASDPTWAIASSWAGQGTRVALRGHDGPVEFKVAGSLAPGLLAGIIASSRGLAPLAGSVQGTTLLVEARPGVDPAVLALDIRRSTFSQGVEAVTTRTVIDQGQAQSHTWSWIFRMLTLIGLVAGVLSLGVLALRSVLERRRTIGVLRALGSQSRGVLAGILLEGVLTTSLALIVGLLAGLQSSTFLLEALAEAGPAPSHDFANAASSLLVVFGILIAVTLLVTIGPARMAARLAPVDALRSID
jgi:putative ABC transport system permease protein